jgi:hypothetical protein
MEKKRLLGHFSGIEKEFIYQLCLENEPAGEE